MTPFNKELLARMNSARNFPTGTCPASRHTAMIGEHLAKGKPYPMLQEEPEHVAGSLMATVAALWEAREALEAERSRCAAIAEAMGCDAVAAAIRNPNPLSADEEQME